eukprot:GILJ01002493.1.p1 GENE.GILJ01002493.1~~GILJ01002493.1.p1  ORF type:complete len:421 (+),score=36.62 GILJ01002493.1:58-1263(+)
MEAAYKITFPDTLGVRNYRTIKLDTTGSVGEAISRILGKNPLPAGEDPSAYGLFLPPCPAFDNGSWMKEADLLSKYSAARQETMEYRKRQRLLTVSLVDGHSRKTVLIDDLMTVAELVPLCTKKYGVSFGEEFSLAVDAPVAGEHRWLRPELPLRVQNVRDDQAVILKKKLFIGDFVVDDTDPITLHLVYIQGRQSIVQGVYSCGQEEALQLAGLQMQITYGNYDPLAHVAGFLNLEEFLPPTVRKIDFIEEDVYSQHRRLMNIDEVECKYRYVKICRGLKTYGITFFAVKEPPKGPNLYPRAVLLGVSRDAIVFCHPTTKDLFSRHVLNQVSRWTASPFTFSFDVCETVPESTITVETTEGEAIAELINDYFVIAKRRRTDPSLASLSMSDSDELSSAQA